MKYIYITIISLFIVSCATERGAISYLLLDKHSGKVPLRFGEDDYIYGYFDVYLVENLPEREAVRKLDSVEYNILYEFFKENNKVCLLEDDIESYEMMFYRNTNCTRSFIDNSEDHTGAFQSRLEDCDDGCYDFYFKRSESNKDMFLMRNKRWGIVYRDTINCNPKREKIKLPDMSN